MLERCQLCKFLDAKTALNLPLATGTVGGQDKFHLSILHVEHVCGEHADSQARREVAIEVPADHILVLLSISDIMAEENVNLAHAGDDVDVRKCACCTP